MVERYELRNMVEAEQVEFGKLLRGLTPEQWDDAVVVRGLVGPRRRDPHRRSTRTPVCWNANVGFARARFSEDRQMEPERARYDRRPRSTWLESPAAARVEPVDILTQLSELVHPPAGRPSATRRRPRRSRPSGWRSCSTSASRPGGLTLTIGALAQAGEGTAAGRAPTSPWSAGRRARGARPGRGDPHGAQRPGRALLADLEGDGVRGPRRADALAGDARLAPLVTGLVPLALDVREC